MIVVIDTSGSMGDEAADLSAAADAAIQAAMANCPADLRVSWFGIEGTWVARDPSTKFTQSYREYLLANGLISSDADLIGTPGDLEDGAAAIVDLAEHFDWRGSATRAIFFLGDEPLEGGTPQDANDVAAADGAIAAANARAVTVFTYAGTGILEAAKSEYARVASDTGGIAFESPVANLGGFESVLEQIICASGRGACVAIELPEISPSFEVRWGDGPDDNLETDDVEVLCIVASNRYSNVTFRDLKLHLVVTTSSGAPVPVLPDGTPSVLIKPSFEICFGDVGPCDPDVEDGFQSVSREVVLITRGAVEGPYTINMVSCFSAVFPMLGVDHVKIPLVRS
ncbi:MAG: hypothetical protein HOH95_08240 [Dehalococcoidia bacterium]|nr:hypothetical protein [Dehalococcoidia bacterium]